MKEGEIRQKAIEADQLNFHDRTDDVVRSVPSAKGIDEAVVAMTSHINKYDVPDEMEEK